MTATTSRSINLDKTD